MQSLDGLNIQFLSDWSVRKENVAAHGLQVPANELTSIDISVNLETYGAYN